ncbi:MAG: hypothetical protein UCH84_07170 [Eubacterium sp.]|uniref:ribbon-helix-helix protein, CopG family n=1 Tax=uncultured Eubacterium sp. TaxID=165185 RepID=UPI002675A55A|nr:ribbon-helix-helix protein, CopG family [uncultured Eubacterium sp.]MEE0716361.1 hypothetical protein [Eubacterium sp.]
MGNKYTEAQKKAIIKYSSKFENIKLQLSPELKQELTEHCKERNISVAAFARQAIINQIELDKKKRP